jgi:hypothetical protein
MSENDDNPNGEFGYGNPPKDTRFRKGVSGNPSGRPSGVRNWWTELYRVAREKTVINENGESKTVTNREAIINQLKNMAKSGNLAAMRLYFNLEVMARNRVILPYCLRSGVQAPMEAASGNWGPDRTLTRLERLQLMREGQPLPPQAGHEDFLIPRAGNQLLRSRAGLQS